MNEKLSLIAIAMVLSTYAFGDDIVILSHTHNSSEFSFTASQDYLPFNAYSTVFINDSLTLQIGKMCETALIANYERGQVWV